MNEINVYRSESNVETSRREALEISNKTFKEGSVYLVYIFLMGEGAFAIYLEPWHADVFEFLELRKNHGKEEHRAKDLFYALWVPELFMERVQSDGQWSLFCPNEAPGLADCWGDEFEKLYTKYEREMKMQANFLL